MSLHMLVAKGQSIESACADAVALAIKLDRRIHFTFDKVKLEAKPTNTAGDLLKKFISECRAGRDESDKLWNTELNCCLQLVQSLNADAARRVSKILESTRRGV